MNKSEIKWLKSILRKIQPRRKEQIVKDKKKYNRKKKYDMDIDY
jgi:hypothetical protein